MKHISEFLQEACEEIFEERAGIREFFGKQPRSIAENNARTEALEWREARELAAKDAEVNK